MIRHLTPADYVEMPWANGLGTTIEMLRVDEGGLKYRLSRARVMQDGAFSIFPQIERNLTVISGPGFDLLGDGLHLHAAPLQPVAFAGDIPLRAANVTAPCDDFNVMTARHLPRPDVRIITKAAVPAGGQIALYALQPGRVNGLAVGRHDLILTDKGAKADGHFIAVRLFA
jgi:environmental stress-induced protein Ves